MLAKVHSFGLVGIEAYPIEIEVDVSRGLPVVRLVGMADTSIRESKERVKAAIRNSGFDWPQERITISLVPSDIKKEGSSFDLAIALGILAASEQVSTKNLDKYYILGELSLDGLIRPARGALPVAIAISSGPVKPLFAANKKNIVLPSLNAKEAAIVPGICVWPMQTLRETVEFLSNPEGFLPFKLDVNNLFASKGSYAVDFSEVKSQYFAKRALEVAVAGGHNILLIGPPGSGKTMLARRIPTIMPDLTLEEALEITKVHSVMGTLPAKEGIMNLRPFRAPHHTSSNIALAGGGPLPQPGEISLAHQGVLFLDELPEFRRDALEALRQPLEDGFISISRIKKSFIFPASFMLVAAMNPCPCGYYTDQKKACRCNTTKIQNYLAKISGPLLDRIDIHVELPAIKYKELSDSKDAEGSYIIKERIERARMIQRSRLQSEGIFYNARMNTRLIKKYCALEDEAKTLLKMAMAELGLSARAYDKILKVSRTISDLAESENIQTAHISEAIQYRSLDKQ